MKAKPVAVLTIIYTILLALLGTAGVTELLPPMVLTIATGVSVILGVVLGVIAHGNVTPLADPRDNNGAQLVPRTSVQRNLG